MWLGGSSALCAAISRRARSSCLKRSSFNGEQRKFRQIGERIERGRLQPCAAWKMHEPSSA
jgi:hypothetical protein